MVPQVPTLQEYLSCCYIGSCTSNHAQYGSVLILLPAGFGQFTFRSCLSACPDSLQLLQFSFPPSFLPWHGCFELPLPVMSSSSLRLLCHIPLLPAPAHPDCPFLSQSISSAASAALSQITFSPLKLPPGFSGRSFTFQFWCLKAPILQGLQSVS